MNLGVEKILKTLGCGFLNFGEKGFFYGPQGRLLRRNVESVWFEKCVTAAPYNVFLTSYDKVGESLENLQESETQPFGLAVIEDTKTLWNQTFFPPECKSINHRIAKVTVVTDDSQAKDTFHRKQRERKVWWRKFSRNPSRFALTEAKKIGKNREVIDIVAKFEFGDVVLESIVWQQDARKNYPQILDKKESSCGIQIVEHVASLDWGCLAFICDGFEVSGSVGTLKIHPKLSPYKVGFYLDNSDDREAEQGDEENRTKAQEKTRLIIYLNNLLKAKGLETVLTRNKRGMETLHVPLTVSVDDASLVNGIVRVTSQLTTIPEAVHVTDLPKYVASRCA